MKVPTISICNVGRARGVQLNIFFLRRTCVEKGGKVVKEENVIVQDHPPTLLR